ncbi:MAG: PD-(D/E)XK nuclease family protein [Candidatus Omnitrophica bacterium]|nr:PD-(D/E)XK nuclease family protein [Candidatus Omnitrophota bacterium]
MGKLKNVLTWSFSRGRLFNECRRAYYYQYYASWGGWERNSDELARKAYILKNVRNMDAWIGDIVHQAIKWILRTMLNGEGVTLDQARNTIKHQLVKTWEQSRSSAWEKNIKNNLNLLEHYYKREPTREELSRRIRKAVESIYNFYNSGLIDNFSKLEKENFLTIDELDSFNFEGVKTFAIPDLAIKTNKYCLYDWKTGKPSEKDVLQLSCYVLYAVSKWGLDPEDVNIIPIYLTQKGFSTDAVMPVNIDIVKTHIRGSLAEMRAVLLDVKNNKIDAKLCPKAEDSWRCKNCKFQEICLD